MTSLNFFYRKLLYFFKNGDCHICVTSGEEFAKVVPERVTVTCSLPLRRRDSLYPCFKAASNSVYPANGPWKRCYERN